MANGLLIVIDGPAGAGKSTVARRLAERYGLPMLDTGAIYRALALIARERAVAWDDEAGLAALAAEMGGELPRAGQAGQTIGQATGHTRSQGTGQPAAGDAAPGEGRAEPAGEPPIRFVAVPGAPQRVLLGGRDVTDAIRTPEISDGASQVSAHPAVRRGLLGIQRQLGARGCVAEGRDLGTVVFPGAPYKFFLTADDLVRAARRQHELPSGLPLEQVLRDLKSRDERDQKRAAAPLVQAADAVRVDSTGLDLDEVVSAIMAEIDGRRRAG